MLKFELTIDETNLVLAALGKAPFEQVAALIAKLREQAQPQLEKLQEEMTKNSSPPSVE